MHITPHIFLPSEAKQCAQLSASSHQKLIRKVSLTKVDDC